jgi:hypothetical protein
MNNEVEYKVGDLRRLRELEQFVVQNRNYIEAKVVHFDSHIRLSVMSDFDRLAMIELKKFLEGLLQRVPDQYINPTFTE